MVLVKCFIENYKQLFGFACSLTGDEQRAEDILQDTFFRIHRVTVLPDNPKAFIATAIKWTALNEGRGSSKLTSIKVRSKFKSLNAVKNFAATGPGPHELAVTKQLIDVLYTVLPELPKKQLEVIKAYLAYEGPHEYAARAGLNKYTCMVNYTHGIKALKTLMEVA